VPYATVTSRLHTVYGPDVLFNTAFHGVFRFLLRGYVQANIEL